MADYSDQAYFAVVDALNGLVLQLVDMNTSMSEIYSRLIAEGTYLQGIVDELRTLNAALSRIEDSLPAR